MNNIFSNFINLSIGICLESYGDIQKSLNSVDNEIIKLIALGEKEKTEQFLQVEELLKKVLRDSKKLEGSIQEKVSEISKKIQNDLALLSNNDKEIQKNIVEESINSKISEMKELSSKSQSKKPKKTKAA
jgi:hypothetical protein